MGQVNGAVRCRGVAFASMSRTATRPSLALSQWYGSDDERLEVLRNHHPGAAILTSSYACLMS